MFCDDIQTILKQQLYSFILQSLVDNFPTVKYLLTFISNQLVWGYDCFLAKNVTTFPWQAEAEIKNGVTFKGKKRVIWIKFFWEVI